MAAASSGLDAQENEGECGLKKSKCCEEAIFWKEILAQKKLFDIGWSDEIKFQACHKEEGEKHRLSHCTE